MANVASATMSVLTPYVGEIVAKMCVQSAAQAAGKPPEELGVGDLPTVLQAVRAFLGPVAPQDTVDTLVARLEGSLS